MSHRKRRETKQQPDTAGPGNNILGCCIVPLISCATSTPSTLYSFIFTPVRVIYLPLNRKDCFSGWKICDITNPSLKTSTFTYTLFPGRSRTWGRPSSSCSASAFGTPLWARPCFSSAYPWASPQFCHCHLKEQKREDRCPARGIMGLMKPKGPPVQPKGRRQIHDFDSGDNLVMLEQITGSFNKN